jgi:transcriptional regulator with XRE-family HTH domain
MYMRTEASEITYNIRATRQLSMNALGALAGIPASTISRIESGAIEPTIAMLYRIAEAAGFAIESRLIESGRDEPFAMFLSQLKGADVADRRKLIDKMPAVANLSPVSKRYGVRRMEMPGDLEFTLNMLSEQGRNPIVSSLEAVSESITPLRSFNPIIYVTDPSAVTDIQPANKTSPSVMFLISSTENINTYSMEKSGVKMASVEWGLLDALASPGRQQDIAMDIVDFMKGDMK